MSSQINLFENEEKNFSSLKNIGEKSTKTFLELEGECKIENLTLLRVHILKAIFGTLLATVTVVGLLFLFWYKWARAKLWFQPCTIQEATHIYVEGRKTDDLEPIERNNNGIYFYFKKLKYKLEGGSYSPVGYDYETYFDKYSTKSYLSCGLNSEEVSLSRNEYGKNSHPVEIPNFFAYMLDTLLRPYFLLQYIVCIAFFVQRLYMFGALNLGFSLVTTIINYILIYISFRKIKEMAEKSIRVRTLRNGQFIKLESSELVPGDLIDPEDEIICDCIMVDGELYVNEASLTGENMPIGKFAATNVKQTSEGSRWLYEGAKIVEKRDKVLAVVINVGYASRRGRIIRNILNKVYTFPQIFIKTMLYFGEMFIVGLIIYLGTFTLMRSENVSQLIVGFRFVDFLGWTFPPTFPIYFNVAYSFAIRRLKSREILCTEPEKTVLASNMKIMCFDKTGTLTENAVEVNKVFRFKDENNIVDITDNLELEENQFVWKLFATCHTTKNINGELLGDEVDLRMFLFSEFEMNHSQNAEIKFEALNKKREHHLEVLRINQFESKFQSMSVLVRDRADKKVYAFVKGAPEKIERNSVTQIKDFKKTVASLSLGGYRTIAFGYREIPSSDLQTYLEGPRDIYDKNLTPLGLVSFENKLKEDTKETIHRLHVANIEPKIITGDNIYIAIETAVRSGILGAHEQVVLLEGNQQNHNVIGQARRFKGVLLTRNGENTEEETIYLNEEGDYKSQPYPIAVDDAFLTLVPPPNLVPNMKVFARISPENKALIVEKFKSNLTSEYDQRTLFSRLFGPLKGQIGMCGDGANDLMAIKEADVGIGLSNSDASYSASFTIINLLDVDYIIRDSKATVTNLLEIIHYYEFIQFIKIPACLLMVTDSAYWNEGQLLFFNFTSTVIYPIFQARGEPSLTITPKIPNGNLLHISNQLRVWGSIIITVGGLVGGFFYFRSTPEFRPNARPYALVNWNPATHSATCLFLLVLLPYSLYSFFLHISRPWKKQIYHNYILFTLIILNLGGTVTMHFITNITLRRLGTFPITKGSAAILLLISVGSCLAGFLYHKLLNEIGEGCCDGEKVVYDEEVKRKEEQVSIKELKEIEMQEIDMERENENTLGNF